MLVLAQIVDLASELLNLDGIVLCLSFFGDLLALLLRVARVVVVVAVLKATSACASLPVRRKLLEAAVDTLLLSVWAAVELVWPWSLRVVEAIATTDVHVGEPVAHHLHGVAAIVCRSIWCHIWASVGRSRTVVGSDVEGSSTGVERWLMMVEVVVVVVVLREHEGVIVVLAMRRGQEALKCSSMVLLGRGGVHVGKIGLLVLGRQNGNATIVRVAVDALERRNVIGGVG